MYVLSILPHTQKCFQSPGISFLSPQRAGSAGLREARHKPPRKRCAAGQASCGQLVRLDLRDPHTETVRWKEPEIRKKSYGGVPRTLLARTQRCVAAVAGPRDVKRSLCTQQPRWASTPENLRHAYRNTCTRTFTAPFIHHSQNVRRPTDRGDTSQPHDEPRQHPAKWEKPVQTTPLTRFSVYKMFQIDQSTDRGSRSVVASGRGWNGE